MVIRKQVLPKPQTPRAFLLNIGDVDVGQVESDKPQLNNRSSILGATTTKRRAVSAIIEIRTRITIRVEITVAVTVTVTEILTGVITAIAHQPAAIIALAATTIQTKPGTGTIEM